MRALNETLVVPRDAPVYAADGVKMGTVNSVGLQSLRIRQGGLLIRHLTRYMDVPVNFVDRVEHGAVWLSKGVNAVLEVARAVTSEASPAPQLNNTTVETLDGATDVPSVAVPYNAPVYALDGAKLGITVDATRSALIVRTGAPFPSRIPLPVSVIDRIENEQVWLNVSFDDAKRIGAGVMPPPPLTRTPRVVHSEETATVVAAAD